MRKILLLALFFVAVSAIAFQLIPIPDAAEAEKIPPHHHHKRGSNCSHGSWATDDVLGHHHHKNGVDCAHCRWTTSGPSNDTIAPHHHHKRGHNCQHGTWATSEVIYGSPGRCEREDNEPPRTPDPSI